jgi:hypothetical protein
MAGLMILHPLAPFPPPFDRGERTALFSFVIPAKAGIQDCKSTRVALDPGFRRGDG